MRVTNLFLALLTILSVAYAKDPKPYQTGEISQMTSVPCSATRDESSQRLCREYTLQSENVLYNIRSRNQKRDFSLSPGDRVQFRMDKHTIVLRSEADGSKEHPFVVISVSHASEINTADVRPVRLNHLQ